MAFIYTLWMTLVIFLYYASVADTTDTKDPLNGRKILLISMDGFRHDFFQKTETPHFDAMITSGVKVPYLINSFITLTFPCHTSIVTGLYQESHGIIGSSFFDPIYNDTFTMKSLEPKWWNASEPVWTTAVKAGRKVGAFSWPGSSVKHDGIQPTSFRKYDSRVSFGQRLRTVVQWLSRDDYDFAIVYFGEPDHTGHNYGPDDAHTVSAIQDMDDIIGLLMQKLEIYKIKDKTDVIVTSDHGMTRINMVDKIIDIGDHVKKTLIDKVVPSQGPYLNIWPKPNKAQEIVDVLKYVPHIHVFRKNDIPEHFNYKHNRRVSEVFVSADEGWMLITDKNVVKEKHLKGMHGYSNEVMSMKPIFVASGPSFKKGYALPRPIKSVDVYPLLCHLLKITPAPNNGSLKRVMPLLEAGCTQFLPSISLLIVPLVSIWII